MTDDEDRIYRRDLPHWRGRDIVYFVTWRVSATRRHLLPPQRAVVAAALQHFDGQRYDLLAYVVMDDHVHVVVGPRCVRLERIVHSWKSFTAHAIGGGRCVTCWRIPVGAGQGRGLTRSSGRCRMWCE